MLNIMKPEVLVLGQAVDAVQECWQTGRTSRQFHRVFVKCI